MTTTDDIRRYTNGDCWLLAQAIHDLTGWTMVASDDHVMVITPNDELADINGIHPDHAGRHHYHPIADVDDLGWGDAHIDDDTIAVARTLVAAIN